MNRIKKILMSILFLALSLLISCNKNDKISLKGRPEITTPNKESTPLTCYLEFKTTKPYDSVLIQIEGSQRMTTLQYIIIKLFNIS